MDKKYLVMWMQLCEGKLKVKSVHFRFAVHVSNTRVLKLHYRFSTALVLYSTKSTCKF